MPNPYSGIYSLVTPREIQRLYEIVERCGAMGLGFPMWFDEQYNGIIESLPPHAFMMFLDALVLEGELFATEAQRHFSSEIKSTFDHKKEHPESTPQDFGSDQRTWEDLSGQFSEGISDSLRCYQDAAKIQRSVIPRYRSLYARDYGAYRPMKSLNDPRYDHLAKRFIQVEG